MLAVECQNESEMDHPCPSQEQVLAELEILAPEAPFLALGQTVFWDEPMKAGVAVRSKSLGYRRRLIAGVHDTDYFAKFHKKGSMGGYGALPHNDTTTKDLWSAAGEFSVLFGSETVVTKEKLQHSGAKLSRIQSERPGYLDEITEAWGWRGVVALSPEARITAEKPLSPLFPEIFRTFDWAVTESLKLIAGPHRKESEECADQLKSMACDASESDPSATLSDYYRELLPKMYGLVAGEPVDLESTTTTQLLKFNRSTCRSPRFELFSHFLSPATREASCSAYDRAIAGTEIYHLDRFGVGALPFDLYIPGQGRGTLRLGTRGGLVMAPQPIGFSYKKAPSTLDELASILEDRFGPDCVLIGKAVTLIGMLAKEFVFVFHEGASSYVSKSRLLHQYLRKDGISIELNPVLRVRLEPWKALSECCAWFKLPEPMRRPFGVDEVSGCSLSARWTTVSEDQKAVLQTLSELRRPLELVRYLDRSVGGQWNCLASQYEDLHLALDALNESVNAIKVRKEVVQNAIQASIQKRTAAEKAKGEHWRAKIFEKSPTEQDLKDRETWTLAVESAIQEVQTQRKAWQALQVEQEALVTSAEVDKGKTLRKNIAFEAELTRVKLIREAVVASEGLMKAGNRPAAWWFPLVCPDGAWFRATMKSARFCLEPLT